MNALITGGSRGIGKGIAKKLCENGINVAIVGTKPLSDVINVVEELKSINKNIKYIQGNIADPASRKNIIESFLSSFESLDILVNNAGVAPKVRTDMLELSEEGFDYLIDTNLKGTFFLTQLAANYMIKAQQQNYKSPKIINISSVSAYTSSTARAEYCISKAGISMTTMLFADRLAEYGINVYEIRPGIIKTDMTATVTEKYDNLIKNGISPIKRWGFPEDIGNAVYAICSDLFGFSTGEVFNIDGGFHIRRL